MGDFGPALDAVFTNDLAHVPTACTGAWEAYAQDHWLKGAKTSNTPSVANLATEDKVLQVGGSVTPTPRVEEYGCSFRPARACDEVLRKFSSRALGRAGRYSFPCTSQTASRAKFGRAGHCRRQRLSICASNASWVPVRVQIYVEVNSRSCGHDLVWVPYTDTY